MKITRIALTTGKAGEKMTIKFGVDRPYVGVFDWDEAFRQNSDEPVYEVPDAMRMRVHGIETTAECAIRLERQARRRASGTEPFPAVSG